MDPILIKVTFQDLPVELQNNIVLFFNILCVLLISIIIIIYLIILKYTVKYIYNNYNMHYKKRIELP